MAIKETIELRGDASHLINESEKAKKAIEDVGSSAKETGEEGSKATERYSGSIKKSNILVEKLNDLTGGTVNLLLDVSDAAKKAGLSTRAAFIATGVGAFIVALGAIVAYWDDIVDFITGANKQLQIQIDKLERQVELIETSIKLNKLAEESYEIQGKSTEDIIKARRSLIKSQMIELTLLNSKLATQLDIEKSKEMELTFFEKILNLNPGVTGVGFGDMQRARRLQEQSDRLKEITDQINANQLQLAQLNLDLLNLDFSEEDSSDPNKRAKEFTASSVDPDFEKKRLQEYYDWYVGYLQSIRDAEEDSRKIGMKGMQEFSDFADELTQKEIDRYRREKREKKIAEEGKMAIENASLDASATAFNILGSLSEKNKELQVVSIIGENIAGIAKNIINTNAANARLSLELGVAAPPFIAANNIRMVTGIAASAAAAARAISELGGSGDATGGLNGNNSQPAPSFNLVRGTRENQIVEGIQNQDTPIRAYVLSDDVNSAAAADRNRQTRASLG